MKKGLTDPALVKARALFDASGKNLAEIGLAMGFAQPVARKSVWQLFNRIRNPKISTLRSLAKALGVPIEELVSEPRQESGKKRKK